MGENPHIYQNVARNRTAQMGIRDKWGIQG